MWCGRCNKQLFECICDDIEERLNSLKGTAVEPAAMQNLAARKRYQSSKEELKIHPATNKGKN